VATGTGDFRAGGSVTVTVTCAIRLDNLAPLSLRGAKQVRQAYTAPVDPYRGIALGFGNSEGSLGANSRAVGAGG
jgi:hypothetical protein